MSTRRILGFWIVGFIASLGCFTPTDEQQDAGSPIVDGGVVEVDSGVTDAGFVQKNCEAPPDAGPYLYVALFPADCTHLKGNLKVVGVPGGEIADSATSNLSSLKEVDGIVSIDNVYMTQNLRGFGKLERVTGLFSISSSELPSVSAVDRLKELGSFSLFLSDLQDVEFGSLEVIHGDLFIYDNAELQSLAGLRSLRTIEGKLIHGRNPKLRSTALAAFTSRVVIDGGVEPR